MLHRITLDFVRDCFDRKHVNYDDDGDKLVVSAQGTDSFPFKIFISFKVQNDTLTIDAIAPMVDWESEFGFRNVMMGVNFFNVLYAVGNGLICRAGVLMTDDKYFPIARQEFKIDKPVSEEYVFENCIKAGWMDVYTFFCVLPECIERA